MHRKGEGAPYTGLKPAGLGEGPVIPVSEKAIETGSPDAVVDILCETVRGEVLQKIERLTQLKQHVGHGVDASRSYVEAMLGLEVWSHKLYMLAESEAHEAHDEHG